MMKREADNNRVKRAIEHLTAAQTNLDSIKAVDRKDIENVQISMATEWLEWTKKKLNALLPIVLLMVAVNVQGQTIELVRAELQRQHVPHPEIVLAQARLETGNFKSRRCKVDHNLFGIKHNGRYAKYAKWQDSVSDYKARISSRYAGGDYYAFLRRIGYAKDPNYVRKLRRF